ncbi:FAD-binding oxidoreductase [Microbulbifer halophilus]|uniref:FAD-binding oxidoreductase n=1 Tax=Microbulbifer halophilus TaxID=453963 RepID=A0ABW5EHI9_9GAMM|nr:FAD-binding oxidoreductase [Microbulbifer halophilus]MCW8126383.1 FAD-binding oxidoreductase [Microbulbifer halophilus]
MTALFRTPLLLAAALLALPAGAADLKPFTTDGCSAFPDGTAEERELWLDCCIAHDLAYWKGGTYAERLAADRELELCVADQGKPELGRLMRAGVRVGGSPFLPTSFRWGYGWNYPRFYGPLSENERARVEASLSADTTDAP